eukprot:2790626-Pyramimonas_sp.AAC.1
MGQSIQGQAHSTRLEQIYKYIYGEGEESRLRLRASEISTQSYVDRAEYVQLLLASYTTLCAR